MGAGNSIATIGHALLSHVPLVCPAHSEPFNLIVAPAGDRTEQQRQRNAASDCAHACAVEAVGVSLPIVHTCTQLPKPETPSEQTRRTLSLGRYVASPFESSVSGGVVGLVAVWAEAETELRVRRRRSSLKPARTAHT